MCTYARKNYATREIYPYLRINAQFRRCRWQGNGDRRCSRVSQTLGKVTPSWWKKNISSQRRWCRWKCNGPCNCKRVSIKMCLPKTRVGCCRGDSDPRWLWKEFSGFARQDVLVVSQDSLDSFIFCIVNKNQGIRGAVNVQDVSPVFTCDGMKIVLQPECFWIQALSSLNREDCWSLHYLVRGPLIQWNFLNSCDDPCSRTHASEHDWVSFQFLSFFLNSDQPKAIHSILLKE